jgi:hypothetical protein
MLPAADTPLAPPCHIHIALIFLRRCRHFLHYAIDFIFIFRMLPMLRRALTPLMPVFAAAPKRAERCRRRRCRCAAAAAAMLPPLKPTFFAAAFRFARVAAAIIFAAPLIFFSTHFHYADFIDSPLRRVAIFGQRLPPLRYCRAAITFSTLFSILRFHFSHYFAD